jgi:hypothetical protein
MPTTHNQDTMPKAHRPFLFLDGEGGNRKDGSHDYMVLCGWSEYTGKLILRNDDGSPLRTKQILQWLLSLSARLKSEGVPHTFVGFGLGYDIAMWLKEMPERPAERLYRPDLVGWVDDKGTPRYSPYGPYSFRQLGSEFSIIESTWGLGARVTKDKRKSIAVWDIWKFFQGSFVTALTNWKILSQDDLDRMEAMKKKRSTFEADEIDQEIIDYCLSECQAGVALMTKLDQTCLGLGFELRRYDGAGSLAAAMLKAWGVENYMAPVPTVMSRPVASAYFGGRFEIAAHGRIKSTVWQYDINSAYPHIIRSLPCLACGKWRRSTEVQSDGIYEVEWKIGPECRWGPLPHRNTRGEITYPNAGRGWYWGSEVLAALRLYGSMFNIRQGWSFDRQCSHVPFAEVPNVYKQRQQLGKAAAGIVLKLGLNSLYGKTAQSVGRPKYANYIWAGMITAGCRAMILDAIRIAGPDHVLMTATDSILTDKQVYLIGSKEKLLGEWDEATSPNGILIIQPGITIAYDENETPTYKSRGLGKSEFARHSGAAETAWQRLGIFGSFHAKSHRFVGIKSALARNDFDSRCRWVDVDSTLKYFPGSKRYIPKSELTAYLKHKPSWSLARDEWEEISQPYKQIHMRLTNDGFDEAADITEQPALECELLELRE